MEEVRRRYPYAYRLYSDWLVRLQVAQGAAAAVEFMHSHSVVHRDLTSGNVLLKPKAPGMGMEAQVRCLEG